MIKCSTARQVQKIPDAKASRDLGWVPEVAISDGISRLRRWIETRDA